MTFVTFFLATRLDFVPNFRSRCMPVGIFSYDQPAMRIADRV